MLFIRQLLFLWLARGILTAESSPSSLTTIITNSNLGSDFSINTVDESSTTRSKKSTSTTSTSVTSSSATEDSNDQGLLKFVFTESDSYYNILATIDSQQMGLRLDILQNDVWVLNGNDILNCTDYDKWWSSAESMYSDTSDSLLPSSVTQATEYLATICADSGVFVTDDAFIEDIQQPGFGSLDNFESFQVPYLNTLNVSGTVLTSNFSIVSSESNSLAVADLPFLDVNSSNVFVGALGLAKNKMTETGILEALTNAELIKANSYSLYFNEFSDTNLAFAQVLPGVVNKKYYVGDLYQFDMLQKDGNKFPPQNAHENELLSNMILPIVQLDDVSVENDSNGDLLSLSSKIGSIPALFDTRTTFNMMPLDIIVNLAIQTNAFYNSDANRWIVNCESLRNAHASVRFSFGDFKVNVPITDVLVNATANGNQLTFTNGDPACFLNFLPSSNKYITLGLSVLKSIYLVVDNDGETVGMATANKQLSVSQSSYFSSERNNTKEATGNSTSDVSFDGDTDIPEDAKSISQIKSGNIPFASTVNISDPLTLSYSNNENDPDTLTIPARFSGVVITSGEVFITQSIEATNSFGGMATAASEDDDSHSTGNGGSVARSFLNVDILNVKGSMVVPYLMMVCLSIVMLM